MSPVSNNANIGHLVLLEANLEEDASQVSIPISEGPNIIGRSNIPGLQDNCVSRKHLTLTASANGDCTLLVEGTNPIVIISKGLRRKLSFGEAASILNEDILELIPGVSYFKFLLLHDFRCGVESKKRKSIIEVEDATCKKQDSKPEAENIEGSKSQEVKMCKADEGNYAYTFRLLRVEGLPEWANRSCVSISDVIQGDVSAAILSNYMVDIDWLLASCPTLKKIPRVMIIHGQEGASLEIMKRSKPSSWILHKPSLPIPFGTHHSKAMILMYPRGVRIVIHTANLIAVDWNYKTQGLWMQDFPWKSTSKSCAFENDLIDYLNALKWPRFNVSLPEQGDLNITPSFFQKFDFNDASVRLISSIPGYHNGTNLNKWGHMKLRSILQECTFDNEFKCSPLIYQFSSLGSLDEKWMAEFAQSMSSGRANDKAPLGLGNPQIIWPTVEDVRCSLQGYASGNAIPSPMKNVEKGFLKKYWAKWKASHTGRCRAMPHIKTYCRYKGQNVAWFALTSSNLSKAAWGCLQKGNSQLMIRSYELGVLFLPTQSRMKARRFSCTESNFEGKELGINEVMSLVTLQSQSSCGITLPVPYEVPPLPYTSQDEPWSWEGCYSTEDVYGNVWPSSAL